MVDIDWYMWIALAVAPFIFGWIGRMNGGGPPKLPLGLDAWLASLPAGLLAAAFVHDRPDKFDFFDVSWMDWAPNNLDLYGFPIIIAFASLFLGQRLGHGQYFDFARYIFHTTAEKIDFVVRLFFGKDKNTDEDFTGKGNLDRDFFGLNMTGFVTTLGISIVGFISGHFWLGLMLLLAGFLKSPAYWIGYFWIGKRDGWWHHINHPTAQGEILFPFFRTSVFTLAYVVLKTEIYV